MNGKLISELNDGKLEWEQLLNPQELAEWCSKKRMPQSVADKENVIGAIVYRFVFPTLKEEGSVPCYIGEGQSIERLKNHFRPNPPSCPYSDLDPDVPGGWWVRWAIRNSGGPFHLQYLKLSGTLHFWGIEISDQSLSSVFARRLLENWAVLHARDFDMMSPKNGDSRRK